MNTVKNYSLGYYGYIIDEIPTDIFNDLKNEASTPTSETSRMVSGLSGPGVPDHFFKDRSLPQNKRFEEYILSLKDVYLNTYKDYILNYSILNDDLPFTLANSWFNFQKKHQYLPNHIHDGILSFSAWITIPYDREKELNECQLGNNRRTVASFEFTYLSNIGNITNLVLPIDKSFEGKIMMFPSKLQHCVYPFYTSDDLRVSLSGNIIFDSRGRKK